MFEEFPFLLAEIVPPHYLEAADFDPFMALCEQILTEYRSDSAYKYKIISNLLVVMLLRIKEMLWDNYNPTQEGDRGSQIVTSFKQKLETHFRDLVDGDQGQLQSYYLKHDCARPCVYRKGRWKTACRVSRHSMS